MRCVDQGLRIFVRMSGSWLLERRTWTWFVLALGVRAILFWIFLNAHGLHHGYWGWGSANGDTASYFDPIDRYLAGEGYRPDMRMPGYGIIYLVLRWFTTPQGAGSAIIVLQGVLSAFSCVALMRTGAMVGLNARMQRVLFWTGTTCLQIAFYDVQLLTESFCISALILAVHDLLLARRDASRTALLTAGAWLTWAIFLRPVHAVLLPLFLWAVWTSSTGSDRWIRLVLLLLPFAVTDGWWMQRNWRMHHRVRPLANSLYYPWSVHAPIFNISRYVRAYGGNHTWWDPTADIRWFNVREGPLGRQGPRPDRDVRLPDAALSEHCTIDSLRSLADDMARWSHASTTPDERLAIGRTMEARVDRCIDQYRSDRPFSYHVLSRFRMLAHLLARSGQEPLFEPYRKRDPPFARALILWNDAWYWLAMPAGVLMAVLTLWHWRSMDPGINFLSVLLLAGILVHPFVLRLCQGRYLVPMLPFMAVLAIVFAHRIMTHTRRT